MPHSKCPFCFGEVEPSARKCRHCGEWLNQGGPPPASPPVAPPPSAPVRRDDSPTFAIVTLVLWVTMAPVGMLLNLIGLITGPRRGCFAAMLLFFVILPTVGTFAVVVFNPEFAEWMSHRIDEWIDWLR